MLLRACLAFYNTFIILCYMTRPGLAGLCLFWLYSFYIAHERGYHFCRHYMAEILPIRRKTLSSQSINHFNLFDSILMLRPKSDDRRHSPQWFICYSQLTPMHDVQYTMVINVKVRCCRKNVTFVMPSYEGVKIFVRFMYRYHDVIS